MENFKSERVSDFCQKQHFWCVHSHRGGGALVSGVLVPMDASKMLFLAKIGNFFTFEVRSETFSLFHFWSTIKKTVFGKNRKLVFGKNQKYFFTSKNGTFSLFRFPHFFKRPFLKANCYPFLYFWRLFFGNRSFPKYFFLKLFCGEKWKSEKQPFLEIVSS